MTESAILIFYFEAKITKEDLVKHGSEMRLAYWVRLYLYIWTAQLPARRSDMAGPTKYTDIVNE